MVTPRTMPGVLELLPAEQVTFRRMLETIRAAYERFGFVELETPAIELAEVLLTKTGGETEREVYFVQSTGAREQGLEPDLALRFDLTVPLARYVAQHEQQLAFPFRRYQIQRVYRGESPQRGRFREFYQCDIDVIGRDDLDLRYDAEMPAVIHRVFTDLEIGPFTIRLNNRRLMRGLLSSLGVGDPSHQSAVLREVDKLEKRGLDATATALVDVGMAPAAVDRLLETVSYRSSSLDDALETLDRLSAEFGDAAGGAADQATVLEAIAAFGVPEDAYALDLSIARGLDYYTGTVYETVLDDHPGIGSVCSGGRYDDLAGYYTSSKLPGVGISIGLTRLFYQLREAGIVGASPAVTQVLVTLMDPAGFAYALEVGRRLRQAGIPTETRPAPSRLGKQLKYADRLGIRFAVICGEDERSRDTVTVRDLRHGNQDEVPRSDLVRHLRTLIDQE